MIQHRPHDYPHEYLPEPHKWYARKWDDQHKVPEGASNQTYDMERHVLIYLSGGEQVEIPTLTPPPWVVKVR